MRKKITIGIMMLFLGMMGTSMLGMFIPEQKEPTPEPQTPVLVQNLPAQYYEENYTYERLIQEVQEGILNPDTLPPEIKRLLPLP